MRSRPVRVLSLGLLTLLAGCGVGPLAPSPATPRPVPPDQLVLSVEGWGGMVPSFNLALGTPGIALYGDGRLVTFVAGGDAPDVPAAYQVARATPEDVARFAADAEAAHLVDGDTDFGSPSVTDLPVTNVRLQGAGEAHQVSIYGFSDQVTEGLSGRQKRLRSRLQALIDRALDLPSGDATPQPYRPDQLRVIELRPPDGSADPTLDWPGPDPDTFLEPDPSPGSRLACGILAGAAAAPTYAAARGNPGGHWRVDGRPRQLAVVALLPGAQGCEP